MKEIILLLTSLAFSAELVTHSTPPLNPDAALSKLTEGNKRYIQQKLKHPHQTQNRVHEVAKGQHPFAAVLGCADSRVPPEIIYDQGIGDLFVVREAGHIVDDAVVASLEYAVEHLEVPLIVVLGHKRCGAVDAAIHNAYHGHIGTLVDAISPALEKIQHQSGDKVDLAVRANIDLVTEKLKRAKPILEEKIKNGKLKIVGAYYDLDTGKVEITSH